MVIEDLSHLAPDQRRRKRGIVADGEHIGFNLAFMDSAPASQTTADSAPLSVADAGAATLSRVLSATGRSSALSSAGRGQALRDQFAAEARERQAVNDAVVATKVAIHVPPPPTLAHDTATIGKALCDEARAARFR